MALTRFFSWKLEQMMIYAIYSLSVLTLLPLD